MARAQKDYIDRNAIKKDSAAAGSTNNESNLNAPNGTIWINSSITCPAPGTLQAALGSVRNGKGSVLP